MKTRNPYKFLDAYTKDDIDIFFGRQRECREIHSRLSFKNILLVYGASGCGKTSILQCGLASVFREELPDGSYALNWLPLSIRRKDNIIQNINGVFDEHLNEKQRESLSLIEKLEQITLKYRKEVYLIFDQFEELFIFGNEDEKVALLNILKEINTKTDNKIIISIREEYLASLTSFEGSIPDLFENRVRIERFNKRSARQLITKPCEVSGVQIDDLAVTRILEKLQLPSGMIELTWLQVVMDSLFRSKIQDTARHFHITTADADKLSRLDDVLSDFLNEQIQLSPDPDMYESILKCLISDEGTKRHVRQHEIRQSLMELSSSGVSSERKNYKSVEDLSDQDLSVLLNDLVSKRILKDKDDEGRYELRHDSLAACIFKKVTLYEKDLWAKKKLIELYHQDYEKTGRQENLLPQQVLNSILPYERHFVLSRQHQNYIQKSKAAAHAKRRRGRAVVSTIISIIFVLLSTAAVYSYLKSQQASRERALAQQNERRAIAENYNFMAREQAQHDPTIALRLVEHALTFDSENMSILRNLNRIYYDNNFYSIIAHFQQPFTALELSADARYMLTGYHDGTAVLRDNEGNALQEFVGHQGVIQSLAFSPDGEFILTGSNDRTAILWDLRGNKIQQFTGHNGIIRAVAFTPDGRYVITGSNDRSIKLWNRQGRIVQDFRGQHGAITSLAVSPDGNYIASSSRRMVRLWDMQANVLQNYYRHQDIFLATAFSPDGNYILTGSEDRIARVWDKQGNMVLELTGHQERINSVCFSPDGRFIITGSNDSSIKLWDWHGNIIQEFFGHHEGITAMAFMPDGKHIITGSDDQSIRRWALQGMLVQDFTRHTASVRAVAFSPTGQHIITGSNDGIARLWDVRGNILREFARQDESVISVAFSNDGNMVLTATINKAVLWNLNGSILQRFSDSQHPVTKADFAPDGNSIITASWDNTARQWDLRGNVLKTFSGHRARVSAVRFSPDGQKLLTGANDRTAFLWDMNGNIIQTFSGHQDNITDVQFSPNGNYVVTASLDNTARLYDIRGNLLQIFSGHQGQVLSVDFSADGKYIVTGSNDNRAIVWGRDGSMLQIISGHQNDVAAVAFSPGSKHILTGSHDQTAKLWELKMDYHEFHKENNYEQLSIRNKIAYGILKYEDVLELDNDEDLFMAADYYFYLSVYDTGSFDEELKQLNNAMQLLNRLIRANVGVARYHIKMLEVISHLDRTESLAKQREHLRLIRNNLNKFSYNDKLIIAQYLLDNAISIVETESINEFAGLSLAFYEAVLKNNDCLQCASPLAELSYIFVLNEQPGKAMNAIQLSNKADADLDIAYAYLPLIYLLNDEFEKASTLYASYKNRPLHDGTYRDYFLQTILEAERQGVNHPDFEEAKSILAQPQPLFYK